MGRIWGDLGSVSEVSRGLRLRLGLRLARRLRRRPARRLQCRGSVSEAFISTHLDPSRVTSCHLE